MTAVATSASRDARNADEFVALLAEEGITLSVVPGEREAALSFAGASCDFAGERILVVDVGGGSTELVAGQAGEAPVQAHSFDIGCRRVTEKFLEADPPSDEELGRARAWIAAGMRPYFDDLRASGFAPERVVAVAGTATSVVAVHERMTKYDSSRVHRSVVGRPVLDEVYAQLAGVGLDERRRTVRALGVEMDFVTDAGVFSRDLAGGAGSGRHAVVHGERIRHPARHRVGIRAHRGVARPRVGSASP